MRRTRGRQRALAHRTQAKDGVLEQKPWQSMVYHDAPTEPLDAEGVEGIHNTAMRILEEIGIDFLHEDARAHLIGAGCRLEEPARIRMDRGFVEEQIALAPSAFTITPRNPARAITLGPSQVVFTLVGSPPNVMDLDEGRRVGNHKDFRNLIKLSQMFNCIHTNAGYPVEPIDLHASVRHLDALYDILTLTDKVMHAYYLGRGRMEDALEMARIAAGLSQEDFVAQPRMFTNINSSSPLKHDWPMLDGAMLCARHGQPVVVSPFTLSGAMAPITIPGAIALQTAEALACIALLQVVNPGTPVVMGAFTSNVDMKTGAPAFGTPEYMRAMQISGQMARRYGLPWRGSNANASTVPDGQAIWESCHSLFGVFGGHANLIYHGAGWLESGLVASFEKLVMDCEMLQQWMHYHQPVVVDEETLALDAIKEVGPHGHFLGCAHTQARYKDAYYAPFLSDWSNVEQWEEQGGLWAHQRANRIYKEMLANYEPPPMDEGAREELQAFVARRKKEGGVPTDF